jgi:hypothetical protein
MLKMERGNPMRVQEILTADHEIRYVVVDESGNLAERQRKGQVWREHSTRKFTNFS